MTKTFKVIPIEDYGVVVDMEPEVKSGDIVIDTDGKIVKLTTEHDISNDDYKVIGLIGKRLDGVPLIELADELELLFPYIKNPEADNAITNWNYRVFDKREGYKANTNKYSEEDIEKVIEMARTLVEETRGVKNEFDIETILGSSDGTYGVSIKYTDKQILQSLQKQPMPTEVELEMEYSDAGENWFENVKHPKTFKYSRFKNHNEETNTITALNAFYSK